MALSKQKYHQVGTPRVYCDVVQYLKAIGKHHRRTSAWEGSDNLHENDIGSQGWDMNPVRQRIGIVGTPPGGWLREYKQFAEIFEGWTVVEQLSNDFKKLLNGVTYYGILGHNLSSLSDDGDFIVDISCYGVAPNQSTTTLIGDGYDGTYLATINEPLAEADSPHYGKGFTFQFNVNGDPTGKMMELGAMTIGYHYDFPHSPNMNVSISYGFDGISRQRTLGGADLTQINYLKPSWGRFEPFSNTLASDSQDFTDVSPKGRRIIDMSFNYIDKTDMFPKNMHQNTFVQDKYTEGAYQGFDYDMGQHNANILGNFLNLTLGGNLTHILQLDSEAHDFIMVKLDGKATKITQVANGVYDVKFRWIEVW